MRQTVSDEAFVDGIELARQTNRNVAAHFASKGLSLDQIAIGAAYAAFDVAERMAIAGGNADRREAGAAAIEWMRTALDLMERQLMAEHSHA